MSRGRQTDQGEIQGESGDGRPALFANQYVRLGSIVAAVFTLLGLLIPLNVKVFTMSIDRVEQTAAADNARQIEQLKYRNEIAAQIAELTDATRKNLDLIKSMQEDLQKLENTANVKSINDWKRTEMDRWARDAGDVIGTKLPNVWDERYSRKE